MNGVLDGSYAYSSALGSADPVRVGAASVGSYGFNGTIDDVRIYSRALNATEISRIYSNPTNLLYTVSKQDCAYSGGDVQALQVPFSSNQNQNQNAYYYASIKAWAKGTRTAAETASCGISGQVCCGGSTCNSGYACTSGVCAPCGASAQICCAGSTCNSYLTCSSGTCVCGGSGQPCCSGITCNGGYACNASTIACYLICGNLSQSCCPGNTCNLGTLACNTTSVLCQACGNSSQLCCYNGSSTAYDNCTIGASLACNASATPQPLCYLNLVCSVPSVSSVVLNSSSGTNTTSENLSVSFSATVCSGSAYNVTDWRLGGTSIAVLNMPFNRNVSSTTTGAVGDYSTFGNNGTLGGGTASYAPVWVSSGRAGGAYSFDGVNDYITVPNASIPSIMNGTIEAWIKTSNPGSSYRAITARQYQYSMFLNGNEFGLYDWTASAWRGSGSNLNDGLWHHVAVVFRSGVASSTTFYIDGGYSGNTTMTIVAGHNDESFNIGMNANLQYFNGTIDEVRLYSRALSAQQVASDYAAGLAGKSSNTLVSQELAAGNVWTTAVTATDTSNDSATVLSNSVTIAGAGTSLSACANLSTPNTAYTLTQSVSISGATCFNVTAANVTLNCASYSVTGNNSTATFGVYSNQAGTIVENCNISNFETAIYYSGVSNGAVLSNVLSTTATRISAPAAPTYSSALVLAGAFNNNNITNNNISSTYTSLLLSSGPISTSSYNIVSGGTFNSTSSRGLDMEGNLNYNNVSGITVYGDDATYGSVLVWDSTGNRLSNMTVYAGSGGIGMRVGGSSVYSNNTQITNVRVANSAASMLSGISIDGGSNVTVDCQGNNLTGTNTSSTYGIYTTQPNTTIKNCAISKFSHGVYVFNAANATIINTNATAGYSASHGIIISSGNYFNITNSRGTSAYSSGSGIYVYSSSYGTITNSFGNSTSYPGIYLILNANNNSISGSNGTSGSVAGIELDTTCNYNNVTNSIWSSSTGYGADLASSSNNSFANSTMSSTTVDALLLSSSLSNSFINNTFAGPSSAETIGLSGSTYNTFALNNFSTSTSGYYIYDAGSSPNFYNATVNGTNQGNIYLNVMNGSVSITGSAASSISGLYAGSAGAGYPYNKSNSGSKIYAGTDYAPLTPTFGGGSLSACGTLSSPNTVYTLTQSVSINGSTCFSVTASNVTLNCASYSVTGNNSTATYGIYSAQFNTTIKNCNISNFTDGIYFNAASNGTVQNTVASTTQTYGIYLASSSNYNLIANSTGTASSNVGILLYSNSHNSVVNSTGASSSSAGIYIMSSNLNTISGSTGISTASQGICLTTASNNTISNSKINGSDSTYGALLIYLTSQNNTIANNTINGKAATYAVTIQSGPNTGNLFINNTILNATNLVSLDASASSNTFYWNNFTAASGYYVSDANGGNFYNTPISGHGEGNIWYNVMNGSALVTGSTASSISGLYVGIAGVGFPYNSSSSGGMVVGVIDNAPLTNMSCGLSVGQGCCNVAAGSSYAGLNRCYATGTVCNYNTHVCMACGTSSNVCCPSTYTCADTSINCWGWGLAQPGACMCGVPATCTATCQSGYPNLYVCS